MSNGVNIVQRNDNQRLPPPLYGLVLTNTTKNNPPTNSKNAVPAHIVRLYKLLDAHCEFVFLAGEWDRHERPGPTPFPVILNTASPANALQSILLAMRTGPEAAWLVTSGEMHKLDGKTIAHLIVNRNPDKWATAFIKPSKDSPEGLCAIYEPQAVAALMRLAEAGCSSPDEALAQTAEHVELLVPLNPDALE